MHDLNSLAMLTPLSDSDSQPEPEQLNTTTPIALPIRTSHPSPKNLPPPPPPTTTTTTSSAQSIPPSASTLVLHLPELLETILLHLPQKDLLLSQRTSRTFRHTILSSPRLQKALFFAPDWQIESRRFNTYAKGKMVNCLGRRKPENNRLLLRAFPGCYPTVTLVIINDNTPSATAATAAQQQQAPDLDPTATGRRDDKRGAAGTEHWSWEVCISFPSDEPPNTNPAVLYPEASWRRMFLSQPPCTSLHLVRRWQRSSHPAIVREEGIKMGEFVDSATERMGGNGKGKGDGEAQGNGSGGGSGEWHRSYISSDRDWHFEGKIGCEGLLGDVELEKTKAEEFTARLREYLFSRSEVRMNR